MLGLVVGSVGLATRRRDGGTTMSIIKGRDAISQLFRAVERYVAGNGGNVIVIGGIQIQEWPGEPHYFYVAVKCTGQVPKFAERAEGAERS